MADNQKKYVDSEALNIFLGKLKEKLADNSASSFPVGYAATADSANQLAHTLTITNSNGTQILGTFNGSADVSIQVSNEGGGSSNSVLVIGTQEHPTLPVGYTPAQGDIVICVDDITETEGGEEVVVFKGGSEYIYDGSDWVELGAVIDPVDLSDYVQTADLTSAINGLADTYETQTHASSTYETATHADTTYVKKVDVDYVTTEDIDDLFEEEEEEEEPTPEPSPEPDPDPNQDPDPNDDTTQQEIG